LFLSEKTESAAPKAWLRNPNYNLHPWELYHLTDDYSQADNLADKYPGKLKELQQLFAEEAKRNQVYPLLPRTAQFPTPQQQIGFGTWPILQLQRHRRDQRKHNNCLLRPRESHLLKRVRCLARRPLL
jgi:hypothetical protein